MPYKRVDVVIDAFARMPGRRLIVVGNGPDLAMLKGRAPANVTFAGHVSQEAKVRYLQQAKGFVFAGEEDFGIALVEAQACGTPVITFGRGGAVEIVVSGETGLLFDEQTPEALVAAIDRFEQMRFVRCAPHSIKRQSLRCCSFRWEFRALVDRVMQTPIRGTTRRAVADLNQCPDKTSASRHRSVQV